MTERFAETLTRMLGYLNFSSGAVDTGFRQDWNALFEELEPEQRQFDLLGQEFHTHLGELRNSHPGFRDSRQADAVVSLVFDTVWPAYREHHTDLLFHLSEDVFLQPYFLSVLFESTLAELDSDADIAKRVLNRLNDYIGHRPVAVLENGRHMEPYPHERFRPIPVYFKDAGVAWGNYQILIEGVLNFFEETPVDVLQGAHFDCGRMHELAVDVRAYDHTHPVYKRTNYLFGEWDPAQIGLDGFYHRFIVRKIVLDALLFWLDQQRDQMPWEEAVFDANAALCGTILMASSICGSGPGTFDSSISLTDLLPNVAKQRDDFYQRLLASTSGERKARLESYLAVNRQPFGHVRQFLNVHLARSGAAQVQHRELAILYARMGYAEASRRQAMAIPSTSIRFESEILSRMRSASLSLDRGQWEPAFRDLQETEGLIKRGIECGALIDPWNILGFAAQFQLFQSREDSIPDPRAEILLEIMEQMFQLYSRTIREIAVSDTHQDLTIVRQRFEILTQQWDKYATHVVDGLPQVLGVIQYKASQQVAEVLKDWTKSDSRGDLAFWKTNIDRLDGEAALEQVVETLLDCEDDVAAMGLLMLWLNRVDEDGLDSSQNSVSHSLLRWMNLTITKSIQQGTPEESFQRFRRMFESLEANAGTLWRVPKLDSMRNSDEQETISLDDAFRPNDEELESEYDDTDEESLFNSAYEGMVFKDSTDDGIEGSIDDSPAPGMDPTELEHLQRRLEPRLRFLHTVSQLWSFTAEFLLFHSKVEDNTNLISLHQEIIDDWYSQTRSMQNDLLELLTAVWNYSIEETSGDHDANIEYDIQHQVKTQILHTIVNTQVSMRMAEWGLAACASKGRRVEDGYAADLKIIELFRALFSRDDETVQKILPLFLRKAKRRQLLYVPFEYGGDPGQILAAQILQGLLRLIVSKLPALGLHRHTWHVVQTAYNMERLSRPNGPAITEFDRLTRHAIRTSMTAILEIFQENQVDPKANDKTEKYEDLVVLLEEFVGWYDHLWGQHSKSMRLSAIENLASESNRDRVRDFISKYGAEFLHARNLTLGNVRAILQMGVEDYLERYVENRDEFSSSPFCKAVETGQIEIEHAAISLELIYNCVSDKFDRFLEYNSTTTHSDYGEKFFCLMDFLFVEAEYERMEWNLTPTCIAHELLVSQGMDEAALFWERTLRDQTESDAEEHLKKLEELESFYGFRLPSIHDHLNEQFVKPLAVNRMILHVHQAMRDIESGQNEHSAFHQLETEVNKYRKDIFGSGIDVPDWLKSLDTEVARHELRKSFPEDFAATLFPRIPQPNLVNDLRSQFRKWSEPLGGKAKPNKKRPENDQGGA